VSKNVTVSPGRLTAMMRRAWGLNEVLGHNRKNRDDHRQHAIDAIVVALTDIGAVQKVMTLSGQGENLNKIKAEDLPVGFWEQIRDRIIGSEEKPGMVVSHRAEHGMGGALHEDSYYGVLYHPDFPPEMDRRTKWEKENGFNIVTRKELSGLSQNEVGQIRDPLIREKLEEILEGLPAIVKKKSGGKEKRIVDTDALKKALYQFGKNNQIRRVRILKKDASIKVIRHKQGEVEHIKGVSPGDIHHVSFWRMPDGKMESLGVSLFDANQKDHNAFRPHPAAKLLMKVHKGDLLRLEHKGEEKTARVMSLRPANGQMVLVEHFEGGDVVKRQKEEQIQIFLSFSKVIEAKARKIFVSPTGKTYDPKSLKVA
jgi:CRISPR-associated endonuclease Csn1